MIEKDLKLTDFIKNIEENLGTSEWVTVFEFLDGSKEVDRGAYFSAIVSNKKIKDVLEKYEWDLRLDGGKPGFCTSYKGNKEITKYYRFYEKGIEPLVYWRTFSGRSEKYYEVSEEFRLYFDLFERRDQNGSTLFLITDEDGEEDEVIRIKNDKVEIKLKYIKEFITVKKMCLIIYFEAMRFSPKTIEELNLSPTDSIVKKDNLTYSICIRNLHLSGNNSQGWLLGKKIILGLKNFTPSIFRSSNSEKYEDFIVGVDKDGEFITASCSNDYQSKINFLTPIFFKREVLKKYFDDPAKYSIEDSYVKMDGFWGLRVMNNHTEHVVVWLGDLKSLPYKEQTHWKSYNISPSNRKISHADFDRNINGEFADPENPELYFKYKLNQFQKDWYKKYKWYLFKPLTKGDEYHLKSLHIPTTDNQKEFDDQIGSLTKIIVDSLNEKELIKDLKNIKSDAKGIDKLENFLVLNGFNSPPMIKFIRNLQELRSSAVAHRKGKNYEKVKKFFDIDSKSLPSVFENILINSIYIFNSLEKYFLRKSTE